MKVALARHPLYAWGRGGDGALRGAGRGERTGGEKPSGYTFLTDTGHWSATNRDGDMTGIIKSLLYTLGKIEPSEMYGTLN